MGAPLPPALSHGRRDDDEGRRGADARRGRAMIRRHTLRMSAAVLPLSATPAMAGEGEDGGRVFHMVRGELDWSRSDGEDLITWASAAWLGGDRDKGWFRSEGEVLGGETEQAELWGLYSRNIAAFWDL